MYTQQRTRSKTKNFVIPSKLSSLSAMLKKRTKSRRVQAIKTELAARTLYVVDGDIIVITSLDRKPFCCQEELSIMARQELCGVARELNKKLPRALHIDYAHHVSSLLIRVRIEEMMGFRHLRTSTKLPNTVYRPPIHIDALVAHQMRTGKRSPTSSFSSGSSRSSSPYGLSVVAEMDEDFGEMTCLSPSIKSIPPPTYVQREPRYYEM